MGAANDSQISGKLRVLVVEDDDASRLIGAELLRALGHDVATAENGAEAVRLATSRAFDLVFMDCQMPIMDGLEATRRIREAERAAPLPGRQGKLRLPIVALTARAVAGEREICLKAGMDEHVAKPIDAPRLIAVLDRFGSAPSPDPAETTAGRPGAKATGEREVDDATLRSRCLGKADLALNVLEKAQAAIEATLAAAREAADRGEHGPAARAAHSLKGLAGNIAAMGLHGTILEFEAFLRAHPAADAAELRRRMEPVEAAVQRCLADLPRARLALRGQAAA